MTLFLFLSLGDYIYGYDGNITMVHNTIFNPECYSNNCISFNFIFRIKGLTYAKKTCLQMGNNPRRKLK